MKLNQNSSGLSHKKKKKHIYFFCLFLLNLLQTVSSVLLPFPSSCFLGFNPPLPPPLVPWWRLHSTGYTHTHTHSFLLTTVAQSDTVSLSDNRPLLTKKVRKRCAINSSYLTRNSEKRHTHDPEIRRLRSDVCLELMSLTLYARAGFKKAVYRFLKSFDQSFFFF